MVRDHPGQSLPDYLDERIAASVGRPVRPDARAAQGFEEFFRRHAKGLSIEREAVRVLP
jgi:hypothetical protein